MNDFGFIRAAAASISTRVANPTYNARTAIRNAIVEAEKKEVSLLVLPELSVSGYSCGDLFHQSLLLKKCEEEVAWLAELIHRKPVQLRHSHVGWRSQRNRTEDLPSGSR